MPVEGLAHLLSQARGPGLITQRVDHPAVGLLPFAAFIVPAIAVGPVGIEPTTQGL
jgi:hypothetical protein